ncbi:MAG: DoxX family protein [Saprospirales bacterium]|nr:DoxX family protein [Saprospirales bacterium]
MANAFTNLLSPGGNKDVAYALIRIFLGAALMVRGLFLFLNPEALTKIVDDNSLNMYFSWIAISHLLGGLMLLLGLLTRLGALIQLPEVAYAVFFIHAKQGLMMGGQSFELATMTLFLLLVILVYGAGPLSLDAKLASTVPEE